MDPDAAWKELIAALAANDLCEAELHAKALLGWTDRSGFPPKTLCRVLPREWDRLICRHLCSEVIAAATPPWE
ncbi:MAG TPA: hypothetical protein VGN57_14480 [Pirellulaceae bacterium]|jgi:hypothetical protein|nr:hypothetical protein [Pirellulaceae bacterium]